MKDAYLIGPLLSLLKSRKFVLALTTVIINVLVQYVPQLEPLRGDAQIIISLALGAVIAGITIEDGALNWNSGAILSSYEETEPELKESAGQFVTLAKAEYEELLARLAEVEKKLPLG